MRRRLRQHFEEKTPYNDPGTNDRAVGNAIGRLIDTKGSEREQILSEIHSLSAARTNMMRPQISQIMHDVYKLKTSRINSVLEERKAEIYARLALRH